MKPSDLRHGMRVTVSGRKCFAARNVLASMGLKLNQHGYRVGVVDDRDGVRAALLERYADGLTITEDRPRFRESCPGGKDSWTGEEP